MEPIPLINISMLGIMTGVLITLFFGNPLLNWYLDKQDKKVKEYT